MIGKPTSIIKKTVNDYYGLEPGVLEARDRRYAHVRARSVAIYLAVKLTDYTPGQIGRAIGGRDSGTVQYVYGTALKRIGRDKDYVFEIDAVRLACLSALGRAPKMNRSPDAQASPPIAERQNSLAAYSRRNYQPAPVLVRAPRLNLTAVLMGDPPAHRSALSKMPEGGTHGNYSYTPQLHPIRQADPDITDKGARRKPISRGRQARAYPH